MEEPSDSFGFKGSLSDMVDLWDEFLLTFVL